MLPSSVSPQMTIQKNELWLHGQHNPTGKRQKLQGGTQHTKGHDGAQKQHIRMVTDVQFPPLK